MAYVDPLGPSAGMVWGPAVGRLAHLVGMILRAAAIVLSAVVVADAFLTGAWRGPLMVITQAIQGLMPSQLSGLFVYATPFGGALHGDFIIMALILFVLDWLLQKVWSVLG